MWPNNQEELDGMPKELQNLRVEDKRFEKNRLARPVVPEPQMSSVTLQKILAAQDKLNKQMLDAMEAMRDEMKSGLAALRQEMRKENMEMDEKIQTIQLQVEKMRLDQEELQAEIYEKISSLERLDKDDTLVSEVEAVETDLCRYYHDVDDYYYPGDGESEDDEDGNEAFDDGEDEDDEYQDVQEFENWSDDDDDW